MRVLCTWKNDSTFTLPLSTLVVDSVIQNITQNNFKSVKLYAVKQSSDNIEFPDYDSLRKLALAVNSSADEQTKVNIFGHLVNEPITTSLTGEQTQLEHVVSISSSQTIQPLKATLTNSILNPVTDDVASSSSGEEAASTNSNLNRIRGFHLIPILVIAAIVIGIVFCLKKDNKKTEKVDK